MKWIIGLFIYCLSVSSVFAVEIVSEWGIPAAGLAGWEKGTMSTFTEYHSSGGNPGGHIRAYGNLKTGIINKQPEFTGNYIQKNYNTISLDIMVNLQQLANFKPTITIRYSASFAGWNYELADFTTNAGVWQHFEVYFDPAWSDADTQANGWFLSPGPSKTFQETMEHVWSISVTSSYPQITSKNLGYDNFKLSHVESPPPAETPPQEEKEEGQGETASQETQDPGTGYKETTIQPIKIKPKVLAPPHKLKKRVQ